MKACLNSVSLFISIFMPAAMACPPKEIMRWLMALSAWCISTFGTLRADPQAMPFFCVRTMAGRWYVSTSLLATMPTTP